MITVRDLVVASVAVVVTLGAGQLVSVPAAAGAGDAAAAGHPAAAAPPAVQAAAPPAAAPKMDPPLLKSAIFQWNELTATPTKVGQVRRVIRAQTATLDELESHITTLNPGIASHEPHTHINEEMIILKEGGTIEAYINGTWTPVAPHSMIFMGSNIPHAVRNVGTTPATYYVVNWAPPGLKKGTGAGAQ